MSQWLFADIDKQVLERELGFIMKRAPACPDPAEGGCIGEHCIRCAVGEMTSILRARGVVVPR